MVGNPKKYHIIHARNILVRVSKLLGKTILYLLLFLLFVIGLSHFPPVQRKITRKISGHLSSRIKSKVEIGSISFSAWGDLEIKNLAVWDDQNESILVSENIKVSANTFDLIMGDLTFDEIRITGANCKLALGENGLNIQYIIHAFQPKINQPSKSGDVNLEFRSIVLERFFIDYSSTIDGITLSANIGTFTSKGTGFASDSNKVRANHVLLENTIVKILSAKRIDTEKPIDTLSHNKVLHPDFGTGISFDIRTLEMKDNDFSFHIDQVVNTPKFDPSHIDLKNIQCKLSEIVVHEDTLAVSLKSLSAQLSDFKLSNATTDIRSNQNQFTVSDLYLASNANEFHATLNGSYGLKSTEKGLSNLELTALGKIKPHDFSYFINDSVMNHFIHWKTLELSLKADYFLGRGEFKELNLKTGNSLLQAKGIVQNLFDPENVSWKNVMIEASIGSDFERTITPWLRDIKIPSQINLGLTSSGSPENMKVNGDIFTQWGNIKTNGVASFTGENVRVDMEVVGEKVDIGKFTTFAWLGTSDCSMSIEGIIGADPDMQVKGLIQYVEILNQPVHDIRFENSIVKSNAAAFISISDPKYRCEITSDISFRDSIFVVTDVQMDSFNVNGFLNLDSVLSISGDLKSRILIGQSLFEGNLGGQHITFHHPSIQYSLDTIGVHAMMSSTGSHISFVSDDGHGNLISNFDVRESKDIIKTWTVVLLNAGDRPNLTEGARVLNLNFQMEKATPFQLMGMNIDFSSAGITGKFDEQKHTASLQVTTRNFKGYGINLDTLNTNLGILGDSVNSHISTTNLSYNSIRVGDLDFDMHTKGDTAITNILLTNDSSSILAFDSHILRSDSDILVYPDKLQVFGMDYIIDASNPAHILKRNVLLDNVMITRDDIQIGLNGNLHAFEINVHNADVTKLNYLLSADSTVINNGRLTGNLSYIQNEQIDLNANIEGLRLYNSEPLSVAIKAVSDNNHVPFELSLTNASNHVDLKGEYLIHNGEVDASLLVDISDLQMFQFLVSGTLDKMNGKVKAQAHISGPLRNPGMTGFLRLFDASFTTTSPKLNFMVLDDSIELNGSAIRLKDFTIYDPENNPLTINGALVTKDYQSYNYDLKLHTNQYTLLNKSDSVDSRLTGLLVIGSDIKLTGNARDTKVDASVIIRGNTSLTLNTSNNDIKLLNSEGIVDFIDTVSFAGSAGETKSSFFYDSLIASLPDFSLNSKITIEDSAVIRLNIDEQSGDFIEAAGSATLELGYDRTGNVRVSGNYTIKNGVYRVSFYDLVKKNFELVPGSTINWSGIPENGDLDVKAVHTVKSSSIGLIGDEVGDNEKSIYKRALPYDVGIIIRGTIENPVVSFSLDLPRDERINYPVLANKLDRMKQPEFQSELNKQVFGLLVLGGFLPESSGSDINQNVVATTALYNSVNSLLSGQLNRFASQYIKGVDIDVGIQSYGDYAATGGKTQTAMDFRVTKRIMNDRLSFEVGGDFNLSQDQSGTNTGSKNFRGDIAIVYDLTEQGTKKLKLFNNETYDIIYQEIRNTGISLIFIREFDRGRKRNEKDK